jgi:hypothetical protein
VRSSTCVTTAELTSHTPKMPIEAWYMDESVEDQRSEHRQSPNVPVSRKQLLALGVLTWEGLDADK